ncbi:MAG: hypothetical protein U1G07_06610 [Verrucomicrobiota bacterium]
MAATSETLVREFFELHGLLVCQQRKYTPRGRPADEDIDFYISNPNPRPAQGALPPILSSRDLPLIARALVVVRGWHSETFRVSVLARAPEIFRFLEPKRLKLAVDFFGDGTPIRKLLVVPSLPRLPEARDETVAWLQSRGIDAVIPFPEILTDLINKVEVNRNYQKSDLLEIIRIFKNYDLFREPQLELFKAKRRRATGGPARQPEC